MNKILILTVLISILVGCGNNISSKDINMLTSFCKDNKGLKHLKTGRGALDQDWRNVTEVVVTEVVCNDESVFRVNKGYFAVYTSNGSQFSTSANKHYNTSYSYRIVKQ